MAEKGFGVKEVNLIGASGTPTITSPNNLNLNAVNVAISTNVSIGGTLSVTGNVSIGGTLTYEDVTNIDSIGIVTAREGIKIPDSKYAYLGSDNDLEITHTGSNGNINNKTGDLVIRTLGSGDDIFIDAVDDVNIRVQSTDNAITCIGDGAVTLHYDGGAKLATSNTGVTITGTAVATTFSGSGASLTNLPAANLTGTLPAISGANLTGIAVTEAPVVDYTITANGSSAYRFHGGGVDETADNATLYLIRGQKYRFNNTTGSSHPFALRVSNGGSAYTDGVTGSQNGIQFFTVPYAAPSSLVYQCTVHSGMVGSIVIRGGSSTAAISNNADNRVITGGTDGNLNGEANFTYNGTQVDIAGTTDGVLNLDTTDSRGAFIRFGQGGSYHNMVGCADGLVTGLDKQDLAVRATDNFAIATNGDNERLRILSTGEMGLGTGTPPTGSFHIHLTETPELNLFSTQHSQGNHCKLNFGIGQSASVSGNTGARIEMNIPNSGGAMNGELKFHTNSGDNLVERVRIPAQTWGLLVTNLSSTGATGGYQTNGVSLRQGGDSTMVHDGGPPLTLTRKTNAGKVLDFYNGTTYAGGIYVNGNNQTAIQQGSDYRLKTDITSMTDGINKVKQLNPIYYKSKEGFDTTTVQNGFLAHEVQSVLPTLVDGEKDAPIDEKGKGYQTLNYAGFTPTAIAAIKELIAKVETLEAEVAALKSS